MKYVGKSIKRVDAFEKATGRAKYIDDYQIENMLYGITIRSTKQRAEIINIDTSDIPENIVIVTADDIPGENIVALFHNDQPLLADKIVNYIGEPILLLAGPNIDQIRDFRNKVKIEYRELEPINTMEEASSNKITPIFNDNNIIKKYGYEKGDSVEKYFSDDYTIIEGDYKTGYQEHVYLETQGIIAIPKENGIKILGSLQCPYYVNKALFRGLALERDQIEVENVTTGGAFGGKEEFPSLLSGHAALLALKSQKPVKIIYERTEDISFTTKRHPSKSHHRIAFNNGKIVAMDFDFTLDAGAHSTLSEVVLARGALAATGVYKCPNAKLSSRTVTTNNIPSGAFRGFGAPQAFFAIEQQMNHSAYKLNIDPFTLRKQNILLTGDSTITGQVLEDSIVDVLDLIEKKTNFKSKYNKYKNQKKSRKRKGIGISAYFHGCGFTGRGEEVIKATATVDFSIEKGAVIKVAAVDMGQGVNTIFPQIVADCLDISLDKVSMEKANTSKVPDSGPTVASRTTPVVGGLIYQCCKGLCKEIGVTDKSDFLKMAENKLQKGQIISVSQQYKIPKDITWDDDNFVGNAYPTYSWIANIVEIEIDTVTCEVEVEKITAVHDIGKAINPILVEGQIEGGSLQGLGYSAMENMVSENGVIKQNSITDYIIPTSLDTPEIEIFLVEQPYSKGPFGAKGVGEQPLVGIPPAYVGAVENALQAEFFEIPLTPEKIFRVLKGR